MKLDFSNLCQQHNITLRGIIYAGVDKSQTLKRYNIPNTVKVLLIDANPRGVEQLQANFADSPNVQVVERAIADHNNSVTLHLTSIESNSSILPFKGYTQIYPNIKETEQLTVQCCTLNTLLEELQLNPISFNILILDIQGAELLALQGAIQLLNNLEVIYTTISYEELFEGGALNEQVDSFLTEHQFSRVAEASSYHPSRGEVFYVRQPVIAENSSDVIITPSPAFKLQLIEEELQSLQVQYQQILKELKISQTQLQQSQQQLAEVESQRDQLQSDLEQSQTQLQQSQQQLAETQSQRDQLQSDLERSQTQLQQSQQQLAETQSQRDQLQSDLERSQTQLQQSQQQLAEVESQRDRLQSDLERSQTQLQQSQQQLAEVESQRDRLQSDLERSQTQLKQSQEQLKTTELKRQETQQEFDQSQSELHETREELEITQLQLDEVQVELEHYHSQFNKTKEELKEAQEKLLQTQSELEQTRVLLHQLQTQPQSELISTKRSKSDNAALVKLLARVLTETIDE